MLDLGLAVSLAWAYCQLEDWQLVRELVKRLRRLLVLDKRYTAESLWAYCQLEDWRLRRLLVLDKRCTAESAWTYFQHLLRQPSWLVSEAWGL